MDVRADGSTQMLTITNYKKEHSLYKLKKHFRKSGSDTPNSSKESFEAAQELEAEKLFQDEKRAEEDERERQWRELRKKTVPKANAVPQWYADAPKKSSTRSTLLVDPCSPLQLLYKLLD